MNISKRRNLSITLFLLLSSFFVVHLCFYLLPNVFGSWNAQTIDQLFQFRSSFSLLSPSYDDTIVLVDINDSTVQNMGNFYINRSHHAHLVRNLSKMNISAQVSDFIFAGRTNDEEDRALINAVKNAGNVYFGLAFELKKETSQKKKMINSSKKMAYLENTKWDVVVVGDPSDFYVGINPMITFTELASVSKGLGYLNIKMDRDGVVRRHPLLVRYSGSFYPALALRVICDYLNVPPEQVIVRPGKSIILRNAGKPGETERRDIVIPIDRHGQMFVNFVGPWGRMKHYNFADVIQASRDRHEMEMWGKELSGKIVFISEVITGSSHMGTVPTDAYYPLSGIHANVINNILTESFVRELSFHEMVPIELFLLIIMLVISLRFPPLYFSIGSIVIAASYLGITVGCFLYGQLILNIIRPLLMLVFAIVSILVYRYINEEKEKLEGFRQRDFIRSTFGRYLSNEVVEELLESPRGLKMSGEPCTVTFLISDLRGFTGLASGLPPTDVIPILNRYFESMLETISHYRGTVDELQGDGILAFFGAPIRADDDPERAVACAVAMQRKMHEINEMYRREGLPELDMGIGIHTGEVVVGNIGSVNRSKFGAVGSAINETFRIESYTIGGQILISSKTFEKVQSLVIFQGTIETKFKGVDQSVTLYDVTGIKGKYQISLMPNAPDTLKPIRPTLPIIAYPIAETIVSENGIPGEIIGLGNDSADILLEGSVEIYTNLKISLVTEEASNLSEIYAKVVSLDHDAALKGIRAYLEFTGIQRDMKTFLADRLNLSDSTEFSGGVIVSH